MKRLICALLVGTSCLLSACNFEKPSDMDVPISSSETISTSVPTENVKLSGKTILPARSLYIDPENLNDCVVPVSFNKGDAFLDDTGKMMFKFTVYDCDNYDMVDVADIAVGDIIETHGGSIIVETIKAQQNGYILINENDSEHMVLLIPDDGFYFSGVDCIDFVVPNYYPVKEIESIPVNGDEFVFNDNSDVEKGEISYYAGDLLLDENSKIIYNFMPENTTIRIRDGQVVELNRIYLP